MVECQGVAVHVKVLDLDLPEVGIEHKGVGARTSREAIAGARDEDVIVVTKDC
jgi:hypothetical protein